MRPPVFLLDMDGPMADFDRYFFDRCAEEGWPVDVSLENQTHRFATAHIIDGDHAAEARAMVDAPGWFAELPVTPGAIDGVIALEDAGMDLWVCTKPLDANPTCVNDKLDWIERHFPSLRSKVIVAPDKSMIRGDVLFDDAIDFGQVARASWLPVIFAAPFNGTGSEWDRFTNRKTWDDTSFLVDAALAVASGDPWFE